MTQAGSDLVLIQTSFALLWKLSLKNTDYHKNSLIYIIKQEGLYQNKVTVTVASTIIVKWPIPVNLSAKLKLNFEIFSGNSPRTLNLYFIW